MNYPELKKELLNERSSSIDADFVFETVCRIRRAKIQDPAEIGNAGSFFKNPIINEPSVELLKEKEPDVQVFKLEGNKFKVPAAFLIDKCGWKGIRRSDAGVSEHHALILLNYGSATGKDILNLAKEIENSVFNKFGINLDREVVVV